MSTFDRNAENGYGASSSNDPRDRYLELGTDSNGATHWYCTATESIRVIDADGAQRQCLDVSACSVDAYVRFVRDDVDGRGWADRRYLLPEESPFAALSRER